MSATNEALSAKLEKVLSAGITDDGIKRLRKSVANIIADIDTDIVYRLKDELAGFLVGYVEEMAKSTVQAILNGDESEMRRYLGCERGCWTGRSDSPCYGRQREDHEWHQVIHGTLYEASAVAIRRAIVEAHRDLIASERILDLEDQVRSLVAQVNRLSDEKQVVEQRLRGYQRHEVL